VLDIIVDKAIELRLGARGLRSIVEAIMIDSMFDYPSTENMELTITLEYARDKMNKVNLKRLRAA
jgi:ATP-dependent Clp protease ATP-binding subunit ClpX